MVSNLPMWLILKKERNSVAFIASDSVRENIHNSLSDIHKPHLIALRRAEVARLVSCGWTQAQIASKLGISQSLISRDWKAIIEEALSSQEKISRRIFIESFKALHGLDQALVELWRIIQDSEENSEKMTALTIITKIYGQRIELVTGRHLDKISTIEKTDWTVKDLQ